MNRRIQNMILAALMLALSWLMPFLALLNPAIAQVISPMHIPIFLCGFLCDLPWAALVGFIAPLLRSATSGMPALYPTALAMSFELATYGLMTSLLSRALPARPISTYIALIGAMLAGRAVWGAVSVVLYGLGGTPFTFQMFLSGAFINAAWGIAFHIAIIPPVVFALRRAGLARRPVHG